MSELEKEELTRRINGMSEEEKILACSLMPPEILVNEVEKRFSKQEKRESYFVWSIRSVTTKKVFPRTFEGPKLAEAFRQLRPNPDHWEVVKQEVICGDWTVD